MIRHLTPAGYRAMPWANGRGQTVELWRLDGPKGHTLPSIGILKQWRNQRTTRRDIHANTKAGSASGEIRMSDNPADTASPAGSRTGRTAPDAPVLGQLAGGLLAKIGEYSPIFVGGRATITAPVSGRLYLGVNDDHLPDNAGEFTVAVGIQGRTLR